MRRTSPETILSGWVSIRRLARKMGSGLGARLAPAFGFRHPPRRPLLTEIISALDPAFAGLIPFSTGPRRREAACKPSSVTWVTAVVAIFCSVSWRSPCEGEGADNCQSDVSQSFATLSLNAPDFITQQLAERKI